MSPRHFAARSLFLLAWLALPAVSLAQAPADVEVRDTPGDAGGTILATWSEVPGATEYVVRVALKREGPWEEVQRFAAALQKRSTKPEWFGHSEENEKGYFAQIEGLVPGETEPQLAKGESLETWVQVEAVTPGGSGATEPKSARAEPNWWAPQRTNVFVFAAVFAIVTFWFIGHARRNPNIFVRRIPGLDEMENAIGRATEMGRPILYLNGLNGMDSISTIASVSILGQVSRRVASYDSTILVPCYDPVVLSVSQEVLREGFTAAGRPDRFRPQDCWFITQEQFSYVASVDGLMIREKPAACLYMGYYYAESLLLAETGGSTGAIQIAGTDSVTQLPFFIATCDYTLIGEELYAASAYLSREPILLGSLRSQDLAKIFIVALLLGGTVLGACNLTFIHDLFEVF